MMRDRRGSIAYWNQWTDFLECSIDKRWKRLEKPSGNPGYRPQYIFEISKKNYELILMRYSRGDAVSELGQHFAGLLDAWEEAERLGKDVWSDEIQYTRHAWTVNLDHYIRCFWLTGLALTLNIPDEQWERLLALMGNEGEDALLDRVIASRQPGRRIGDKLCFPQTYQRLLGVVDAPVDKRPQQLRAFLDRWFPSLKNAGCSEWPKDFRTPYWWDFCADKERGMKGAYFGCWCVEAAAVVKVFGIDDQICLDHPNYPGDLLQDGRSPRYPDAAPSVATKPEPPKPVKPAPTTRGWLSRLLRKS